MSEPLDYDGIKALAVEPGPAGQYAPRARPSTILSLAGAPHGGQMPKGSLNLDDLLQRGVHLAGFTIA